MPRRCAVCVVTSEKTWQRLKTYCFNANFKACREQFDLAVVFNGKDLEGRKYVESFSPELFCERPNTGLDLAAYDHLIKRVGVYESYVLLLDGHWFHDPNWFRVLQALLDANPWVDAFGNLVDSSTRPRISTSSAPSSAFRNISRQTFPISSKDWRASTGGRS